MTKVFRYKADRFPVFMIVLLFVLDLFVFFYITNAATVCAWMLLGIFPKSCICSFGHHHQHVLTFRSAFLNRLFEIVLGFQTGITSHAWFLHHVVGHHRHYLNQVLDESRWKRKDGSAMGPVMYSIVVAATGYYRAYIAGSNFRKHRTIFVTTLAIQLSILGLFFLYSWQNALILFVIPMGISFYFTAWHTYYHHAGLETENPMEASYNITHKWYNKLTCNLGYHTAHHVKCGIHWSKLPEFHDKIKDEIPDHLYRQPCIPFRWMPAK